MTRFLFFIALILGCMLLAASTQAHAMNVLHQIVTQLNSVR